MSEIQERKLILGLDPGFSGAIALLNRESKQIVEIFDMPLRLRKNEKNEIDLEQLTENIHFYRSQILLAVVEEVGAMPKQGLSSTFRFGYGAGSCAGILAALQIKTVFVRPAIWKSLMNVTHDKKTSLELARKMFPEVASHLSRQKDDGRAEAALLAYLGTRLAPPGMPNEIFS